MKVFKRLKYWVKRNWLIYRKKAFQLNFEYDDVLKLGCVFRSHWGVEIIHLGNKWFTHRHKFDYPKYVLWENYVGGVDPYKKEVESMLIYNNGFYKTTKRIGQS